MKLQERDNTAMTPDQCLKARKLLKWSRDRLAPRCGISAATLRQFEIGNTSLCAKDRAALKHILERAGIAFPDSDDPLMKLKKQEAALTSQAARKQARADALLNELVREGALVGFSTNYDRSPVWVPTVSIQVAETADLAGVLERVEQALRSLGVSEVVVDRGMPDESVAEHVRAQSIEVGGCYLTTSGHVRRVVRIMPDGRVQFEHRSGAVGRGFGWKAGIQERRSFAVMIEREVPCDWTPEKDR